MIIRLVLSCLTTAGRAFGRYLELPLLKLVKKSICDRLGEIDGLVYPVDGVLDIRCDPLQLHKVYEVAESGWRICQRAWCPSHGGSKVLRVDAILIEIQWQLLPVSYGLHDRDIDHLLGSLYRDHISMGVVQW